MKTPPPRPPGVSLLKQLKPPGNTSDDFILGLSHDLFPITLYACSDVMFLSWAGLPLLLMD